MNSVTAHEVIDSPRRAEENETIWFLTKAGNIGKAVKQDRMRWERESLLYVGKAFTQRFIATLQTSNTWNPCSRCCNGRWPGMCLYASPFVIACAEMWQVYQFVRGTIFISAWASKLLILTGWQVRRPGVWDRWRVRISRFFHIL